MPARPLLKPAARWACTILAITTASAWALSAWFCVVWRCDTNDSLAFILKGRAEIFRTGAATSNSYPPAYATGLSAGRASKLWMWDQHWQWTPFFRLLSSNPLTFHTVIPLWCPPVLTALPASLLWRARVRVRSRRRAGQCPTCGYDRHGLAAEHPCPECGRPKQP
jgi:hypothetical protein